MWNALSSFCDVTRFRLIPIASYEAAERYLSRWLDRLESEFEDEALDASPWRKRREAYIKINTKTDDEQAWLDSYMAENFNHDELRQLSDGELDFVYREIADRRTRNRNMIE